MKLASEMNRLAKQALFDKTMRKIENAATNGEASVDIDRPALFETELLAELLSRLENAGYTYTVHNASAQGTSYIRVFWSS